MATLDCSFKVIDIHVPVQGASAVLSEKVWPVLCPEWDGKEILTKIFERGKVNRSMLCHAADDVTIERGLTVRIYEGERDMSREKYDELVYMQVAHYAGCFSAVRAAFRNGVIYDYVPGQIIGLVGFRQPAIAREITRTLARLHWIDTDSLPLRNRQGQPVKLLRRTNFTGRMREILRDQPYTLDDPQNNARAAKLIDRREQEEIIDFVEQYLEGLDLPTVNSHDDFHGFNIIYDDKSGSLKVLDYEMSGFNSPATNDLSFVLGSSAYNKEMFTRHLRGSDIPDEPEPDEAKRALLRLYLEQKHELEGGSAADITDQEMDLWFTMLQITDVLTHLQHNFVLLLAIQRTTNAERVEFLLDMFDVGFAAYKELKPRLAALREKYLQLKSLSDHKQFVI